MAKFRVLGKVWGGEYMKVEFTLQNDNGCPVGSIVLEGNLAEPIIQEFFDFVVAKAQSYYKNEE